MIEHVNSPWRKDYDVFGLLIVECDEKMYFSERKQRKQTDF